MLVVVLLVAAVVLLVLGVVLESTVAVVAGLGLAVLVCVVLAVLMRSRAPAAAPEKPVAKKKPAAEKAAKPKAAEKAAKPKAAEKAAKPKAAEKPAAEKPTVVKEVPAVAEEPVTVYVVAGRRRFHGPGCSMLEGQSGEEVTVAEAHGEGFTACTLCAPAAVHA